MASRHLSRSLVLQTLFECDMHGTYNQGEADAIMKRNLSDFSFGDTDEAFASSLLSGILSKRDEVDAVIVKAAPQWPLDKIAPIDRNILRIGLFELLFGDRETAPPKVVLNEAIELAKSYGGDSSGKFINGVLGSVYKDIGSPGKDDAPKTGTPMPHEHYGGVAVASTVDGVIKIAFVLDAFSRWTFPKSKCVEGELSDGAAKRSAKEDLGVDVAMQAPLGEHEYIAHEPEKGRVARTVGYFIGCLPANEKISPRHDDTVRDVKWFSEDEVGAVATYDDLLPILQAAFTMARQICI